MMSDSDVVMTPLEILKVLLGGTTLYVIVMAFWIFFTKAKSTHKDSGVHLHDGEGLAGTGGAFITFVYLLVIVDTVVYRWLDMFDATICIRIVLVISVIVGILVEKIRPWRF